MVWKNKYGKNIVIKMKINVYVVILQLLLLIIVNLDIYYPKSKVVKLILIILDQFVLIVIKLWVVNIWLYLCLIVNIRWMRDFMVSKMYNVIKKIYYNKKINYYNKKYNFYKNN